MPNKLAHFAIEADNVDRARKFYEAVFGWEFKSWGPPNFYLIHGAGTNGALQQRSEPNEPGRNGFECSFAVTDLANSIKLIEASGGKLIGDKHQIPTIGELVQFHDTEGNQLIAIQYTPEAMKETGLE